MLFFSQHATEIQHCAGRIGAAKIDLKFTYDPDASGYLSLK